MLRNTPRSVKTSWCHVLLLLCHTLFPLCAPSWEMRSCLKRVRSPTGSQPPRLFESTVRERLWYEYPVSSLVANVHDVKWSSRCLGPCSVAHFQCYQYLQNWFWVSKNLYVGVRHQLSKDHCSPSVAVLAFYVLSGSLQVSTSTWIRTTMACWAKRSCRATAQLRSPQSSWTECFRSASPMMEKWYNQQQYQSERHVVDIQTGDKVVMFVLIYSFNSLCVNVQLQANS